MIIRWMDRTSPDLAQLIGAGDAHPVGLLPLGALEAHGPHLPLATDTILAERLLDAAEPALADGSAVALRLPALWLGASNEHAGQPGTVSVEAEVAIASVAAVAAALAELGVRRLVVLNAHGGNTAALAIAALRARRVHGLLVAHPHWLDFGLPAGLEPPGTWREDVHGGWLETALMLHLAPHLVTVDRATPNPPRRLGSSLYPYGPLPWAWLSEDLAPGGWCGRPDLATAELGRRLCAHIGSGLARLVAELAVAPWP